MTTRSPSADSLASYFVVSAHDLPTRDKIPLIKHMMADDGAGWALDIGIGTGFTTYSVLGDRPNVCVDSYSPNLRYYKNTIALARSSHVPRCVVARATELPFKPAVFKFALCSEVLEHLEDDDGSVRELARVLSEGGRIVITVPHDRGGFSSFLEFVGIKTVHDYPGPEHHFRVGYTENALAALLGRHGLQIEACRYYLRFFTRLVTDLVGLGHLLVQRFAYRRNAWNWADVAALENNSFFKLYTMIFPLVWFLTRLDKLLFWTRGFGLVVGARKTLKTQSSEKANESLTQV